VTAAVDDDVGAEDVTARREARKLTTLATSSGSAARLAQLGGAFGHEVRCAAAFGHCRPHGMPTTWIAPRDEDVRPAGSRLAGHRPSDTRVTSGNQGGLSGKVGCHIWPLVFRATTRSIAAREKWSVNSRKLATLDAEFWS